MFKVFSAGLMCLGLATLGVTMSRGEVGAQEAESSGDVLIGTGVNSEAGLIGNVVLDVRAASEDGGPVTAITNDVTGISFTTGTAAAAPADGARVNVSLGDDVHVAFVESEIDPATRETLTKLIKQLREEEASLRQAGRAEEAAQKLRSAARLEAVIGDKAPHGIVHFRATGKAFDNTLPPPAFARIHQVAKAELQARLAEFEAKRARLQAERPDSPEIAEIERAIQELERAIQVQRKHLEEQRHFLIRRRLAEQPQVFSTEAVIHNRPMVERRQAIATAAPEAIALKHKADALISAAKQLKEAGLEDKSRELSEQAEKLRAEAGKLQDHFVIQFDRLDAPTMELHQSLQELREQVQLLRKEVAELRGLLEKKPAPESTIAPAR